MNLKLKVLLSTIIITLTITLYKVLKPMQSIKTEQHYLDLGYCNIWYQKSFTQETKDKTPIIFVHGGPGLESGYIINLNNLASERPCIFYDQSGCGKAITSKPIDWTFEHYVKELTLIIDKLGFEKVILFGYSWGAALATKYTLEHTDKVEKLILASPYISTLHLIDNYKKLAQSKDIYDIMIKHENAGTTDSQEYQDAYAIFFKNFIFSKDPSIFDNIIVNKEISETMWGSNELSVSGNLKDLNLIPLLHNLNLPVLLTSGINDPMTPSYMDLLHRNIHNSKLVIFEHSTHMPHIEEEETYLKIITNFLRNNK
ncbi:MAG: proline iminopeptidase-family hydrolase [Candidatus Babeliales bacterium]|nr:proline iminopeptidase-family hydrolase [Candidatus Babeliales bacterium]